MITQHRVCLPGNEELAIQIPNVKEDIYIGLDYYGDLAPRLQLLCYEVESDEPKVCVRYDEAGRIVEVQVWRGIAITFEDGPQTPWEINRDGGAPEEKLPEPVTSDNPPPRDRSKSWEVRPWGDSYYWYNEQGDPQGAYESEHQAWQALEDYDDEYYV